MHKTEIFYDPENGIIPNKVYSRYDFLIRSRLVMAVKGSYFNLTKSPPKPRRAK